MALFNRENYSLGHVLFPLGVFFLLCFFGFRKSKLLGLYAGLSFLPFLKVYSEEVHLAYAVAPMAMIFSLGMRELWRSARSGAFTRATVRFASAIALADAGLNVPASFLTTRDIYRGIKERAGYLVVHIPKGSVVIGNNLDLRCMSLYAPFHYEPYFSIHPNWESRQINSLTEIKRIAGTTAEARQVFLLGAVFRRARLKYGYHHLHALALFNDSEGQRFHFSTRTVYPFADPLKHYIPQSLISFPGPPDLVDDYRPSLEGRPFLRSTTADYLLVEVNRRTLDLLISQEKSITGGDLIEEYGAFEIYRSFEDAVTSDPRPIVKSGYFAKPRSLPFFTPYDFYYGSDFRKCVDEQKCFVDSDLRRIKSAIDSGVTKR